jgi:hypothetical protein
MSGLDPRQEEVLRAATEATRDALTVAIRQP